MMKFFVLAASVSAATPVADTLHALQTAAYACIEAYNSGDIDGIVGAYQESTILVVNGKEIGTTREAVRSFWQGQYDSGLRGITFSKEDEKWEKVDDNTYVRSSSWTSNNLFGKVIGETWVLQDDGTSLLSRDEFTAVPKTAETGDLDKGAECVVTATAKAEKCKNAFFCKTASKAEETKCADRIAAEATCTLTGSCVKDYICTGAEGSKKCIKNGAFSYGFTVLAVLAAFFL